MDLKGTLRGKYLGSGCFGGGGAMDQMFDSCLYLLINEWLATSLLRQDAKAMNMDRYEVKGFTAKAYLRGWVHLTSPPVQSFVPTTYTLYRRSDFLRARSGKGCRV